MTDHKQKGTLEKKWTKIIKGTKEITGIYRQDTRNQNSEADLSIQTEQQKPRIVRQLPWTLERKVEKPATLQDLRSAS